MVNQRIFIYKENKATSLRLHSADFYPRKSEAEKQKSCKENYTRAPVGSIEKLIVWVCVCTMEEYMERPRGVKLINTADGHRLCTLLRRKGLYG